MTNDEAYKVAQELYTNTKPDDYRFEQMSVKVITTDGTYLFYPSAFVERHEDYWIVITKNFGFIVLHSSHLLGGEVKEYMEL